MYLFTQRLTFSWLYLFNHHDESKHHLESLKNDLIHPLQVENCDSNSRLVVDEEDHDKFRVEKVIIPVMSLYCYNSSFG